MTSFTAWKNEGSTEMDFYRCNWICMKMHCSIEKEIYRFGAEPIFALSGHCLAAAVAAAFSHKTRRFEIILLNRIYSLKFNLRTIWYKQMIMFSWFKSLDIRPICFICLNIFEPFMIHFYDHVYHARKTWFFVDNLMINTGLVDKLRASKGGKIIRLPKLLSYFPNWYELTDIIGVPGK